MRWVLATVAMVALVSVSCGDDGAPAADVLDPCTLLTTDEASARIGASVDRIGPEEIEQEGEHGVTCTFVPEGTDPDEDLDRSVSVISVGAFEGTEVFPDDELEEVDADTMPITGLGDQAVLVEVIGTIAWTHGGDTYSVTYADAITEETDPDALEALAHQIDTRIT